LIAETTGLTDYSKGYSGLNYTYIEEEHPILLSASLNEETISFLRRWEITTWADLLTPEGQITTDLHQLLPQNLQLPNNTEILPRYIRQG
jgi:hypothetical protein